MLPAPVAAVAIDVHPGPAHRGWVLAAGAEAPWQRVLRLPSSGSQSAHAEAQEQARPAVAADVNIDPGRPREDEWMAGGGLAWSMALFQSAGGRRYGVATASWGRDLTRDGGPGWLRGRLMWAVEAMPLYAQSAPTSTIGAGLSPLVWRWRFTPRRRAAAFAELAFGGIYTRDPVPEGTERLNFLTHGGVGLRWRSDAAWSLVTAYRFQHVSNGNQLSSNPGVNAHVLWIGVASGRRR
ncbi:MAG: acyloxyacyl hydrolase [Vicinamibacterales bacterium]